MPESDQPLLAEVTSLLRELAAGHADRLPLLIARTQGDLRRIAHRQRLSLHAGETLSTTALVNEAFLKFARNGLPTLENRRHFYNAAAQAMRHVLVDYARERVAHKRGGGAVAASLSQLDREAQTAAVDDAAQLLELDDALTRLEAVRPRLAQVVYLRYFAGLDDREIGALLDIEESTVRRDWLKARGWLYHALAVAGP